MDDVSGARLVGKEGTRHKNTYALVSSVLLYTGTKERVEAKGNVIPWSPIMVSRDVSINDLRFYSRVKYRY